MKKKNIQTPVLSMAIAACMISHQQNAQAGENPSLQNDSVPYVTMPDVSPKPPQEMEIPCWILCLQRIQLQ